MGTARGPADRARILLRQISVHSEPNEELVTGRAWKPNRDSPRTKHQMPEREEVELELLLNEPEIAAWLAQLPLSPPERDEDELTPT